jgi:hypothetical protein
MLEHSILMADSKPGLLKVMFSVSVYELPLLWIEAVGGWILPSGKMVIVDAASTGCILTRTINKFRTKSATSAQLTNRLLNKLLPANLCPDIGNIRLVNSWDARFPPFVVEPSLGCSSLPKRNLKREPNLKTAYGVEVLNPFGFGDGQPHQTAYLLNFFGHRTPFVRLS